MQQNQKVVLTIGRWMKLPGKMFIKRDDFHKLFGWNCFENAHILIKSDGKKKNGKNKRA
jgi:hypothetical protein